MASGTAAPRPGYGWAAAVYSALWLLCAHPWLTGRVTIPYDAKALFHAQLQFLASAIHSGQSPAWNPHTFVGVPQIADPQSLIFSPGLLLAYFSPSPTFWSLDLYVVLLLAMAGGVILLVFRDRGWHPGGAALAAICFAFGGSAAWRLQHIGHIQSYAFFALALWLLARARDRGSARWGAAAGLALGLMLAEPNQVAMLGCYLIALIVAASWLTEARPLAAIRRDLAPLAAAGIALTVVAVLPVGLTFAFLAGSNRPSIEFAEAARASLHPASLLSLVIADPFGIRDTAAGYWGPYSEAWNPDELTLSSNMCQLYLGALPILALLGGIARGIIWHPEIRAAVLAAGVALIYALGAFTPVFAGLYAWLPGVHLFRRPADATFLLGGFLAILSGYVVHRFLERDVGSATPHRHLLPALALLLAFACVVLLAVRLGRLGTVYGPLLAASFWIALAAVVMLGIGRLHRPLALGTSMLPALLVGADLAWNNGPSEATGKPTDPLLEVLRPGGRNETVSFLTRHLRRQPGSHWRDRIEVLGLGFDWQNAAEAQGFDQTLGYNPLRTSLVTRAIGAGDYNVGPDQRVFSPLFPSYRCRLADMLGLRFIASSVPIRGIDRKLGEEDLNLLARTPDAYIYENPRALPRVLFAAAAEDANFERILSDGRWPDFDPRRTVLLDPSDGTAPTIRPPAAAGEAARSATSSTAAEPSEPRIVYYRNTSVEVAVEAPKAGYIVLNDVWHPWWSASVDGRPSIIRRANVMFRAVAVPAGRHLVRFDFHPIAGALSDLAGRLPHVPASR